MAVWPTYQFMNHRLDALPLLFHVIFYNALHALKEAFDAGEAEGVKDLEAAFINLNDPGFLEDGQVFGDGGDIGSDHVGQFADTLFPAGKFIDDKQPGRVAESLHDFGPGFVPDLNFGIHNELFLS
jgi:hypothetical protein